MKNQSTLLIFLLFLHLASHGADSSSPVYIKVDNITINKLWLLENLKNNENGISVEGNFNFTDDALDFFVENPKWNLDISAEISGQNYVKVRPIIDKAGFFNYWAKNTNLINPDIFLKKISQIPSAIYINNAMPSSEMITFIATQGFLGISLPPENLDMWNSLNKFTQIGTNNEAGYTFYRDVLEGKSITVDDKNLYHWPTDPGKIDLVICTKEYNLEYAEKIKSWQLEELSSDTLHPEITSRDLPFIKHIKLYSWNEHVKQTLMDVPNLEEITIYSPGQDLVSRDDFKNFVAFANEKKLKSAYFSGWVDNCTYRHINVGAIKTSLLTKIKGNALHELALIDAQINDTTIGILKKLTSVGTLDLSQLNPSVDNVSDILATNNFNTVKLPKTFAEHKTALNKKFPYIRIPLGD
jgi:hypothetical protein